MDSTIPTIGELSTLPPTVNIPTASRIVGISPSYGFQLAKAGEFPAKVIRVGSKLRVVTASLQTLLTAEAA